MVSIRLGGDARRLMKRLEKLSYLDKKHINAALSEAVRGSTVERFKESRDPTGRRWKTSIRAAQEGGKTLVDKGRLRNSIRAKSDASGFAVGTNLIYAGTHQLGAKGRTIRAKNKKALRFKVGGRWVSKRQVRVSIPARPFLGLSEDDLDEIKRTIEDAFSGED